MLLVWFGWSGIELCYFILGWVWLNRMELDLGGAEWSWLAMNLVELSQVGLCQNGLGWVEWSGV